MRLRRCTPSPPGALICARLVLPLLVSGAAIAQSELHGLAIPESASAIVGS